MGKVTEREKMLAGRLYDASDSELVDLRQQARVITRMFNAEEDEEQAQALLKTFFGKTGQNITVHPRFVCDYGSNIYVGENFYANYDCTFLDVCEIRIGDNAMFGPNCQLLTALHPLDAEERIRGKEYGSPITIGDNVWCGAGATILPGVNLGDNVVLAGNPARMIKDLTETSCLTIDIGGSAIKYGLIDERLVVTEENQVPTPASLEEFWSSLTAIVEEYQEKIKAIAISCPGEISKNGRVFRGGLIPYLKNVPLAKQLSEQFSMPVSVLNDANAAALAETKSGVLKDSHCGAILVLGTGVGLGVVSENRLVTFPSRDLRPSLQDLRTNDESVWRQISHSLELNRIGIESLFSNAGSAVKFIADASQLLNLKEADGQKVFQVLENEPSEELQELFETYCRDIAFLILNLQTFLKVENLAIGGGISAQPLLVKAIGEQYDKLFASVLAFQHFEQLEIEGAKNGNKANLIGAYLYLMTSRK